MARSMRDPVAAAVRPRFTVLLGPDYAGKSAALAELARRPAGYRIVSADDAFLAPRHALIGRLRRDLVGEVLTAPARAYSPEFTAALLQTAVVHLRDRLLERAAEDAAEDARAPLVVDSYYYKILAKLRLTGLGDHPMYGWWRTFPQPGHVVFLDVAPATAWRRSGDGALLNGLEHYGTGAGRGAFESFRSFQADLRELLLAEVGHLPVSVLPESGDVEQAAKAVEEVLIQHAGH
ncbi:hypothetical protein [Actinomadura fibrosa]|uniref:Thymidylate kinase n=1 Tax=Actinomadura fibrosa TaxID=111802 RepID=A0ABW2XW20_9ACTN|nr:hypothetical protein [Actinomadura fibrosa]